MSDQVSAKEVVTGLGLIGRMRSGQEPPYATCPHDDEPLVATFEFAGAEFYCVVCHRSYGFLSPKPAEPTPELEARLAVLKAQYDEERVQRQAERP